MTRPGWKLVEQTTPDGRTGTFKVRDVDLHPTYQDLEREIAGALSLGLQEHGMSGGGGRPRAVVRFEVFVDLRNPNRTWRRYEDGRIERGFDVEPAPAPQPIGTLSRRPAHAVNFPAAGEDKIEQLPDPYEGLDPAVVAALRASTGMRG